MAGPNVYSYVENNPIDFWDPWGLDKRRRMIDEVPDNPCKYAGANPDPNFWVKMGHDAKWDPFIFYYDVRYGFNIGGYLDAQPLASGTPYERAAYGNYVFGAYMASQGMGLQDALAGANDVAFLHSLNNPMQYNNRIMDTQFPALPAANVANITTGYNNAKNATLCQK